ncbi:MAG: penicillin-binding protein 1A [Myxococcota bacterium]
MRFQRHHSEPQVDDLSTHSQRDFARFSERKTRVVKTKGGSDKKGGRRPRKKRPLWLRLLKWGVILGLLGAVSAVIAYWALIFYFEHRLPDVFETEDYVARTPEVTRILSAGGDVLAEAGTERRLIVPDDAIPKLLKDAVLAAEDADFYDHAGLDYFGMGRAMYKNVRDGRFSQGASTITQQVAKTFFLTAEKTVSRKLKEVVLARRLEHELTKDEILYLYLNQIYWGHGRYGIAEAARFYFDKTDLRGLTLAECALLAGMIAAPEHFTPLRHGAKAASRRAFVLDQMASHGFADPALTEAAKREPIRVKTDHDPHEGLAPYAMDMVRSLMRRELGADRVRKGGLRVYTTLDTKLQTVAEAALRRGLISVDQRYKLIEPLQRLPKARIRPFVHELSRSVPKRGIRSGAVVVGVVTGVFVEDRIFTVHVGLGEGQIPFDSAERYRGRGEVEDVLEVGDVIRVSARHTLSGSWSPDERKPQFNLDQGPQGALVAIDPRTRHIKAIVGGYDHATHPFNRAVMAKRQVGSTFKPIVYAAALEAGVIEPFTEFANTPEAYPKGDGSFWKPKNFSRRFDGKLYTARMSLAKSINVIAVKILEQTGLTATTDFARRVGVTSDIARDLSIALGSTAMSPLELANTYATFAAAGTLATPVIVTRIEDSRGKILYEAPRKRRRGTTAKVAFQITQMLESVVTNGTAKKLRSLGRPIAGKTGTTDRGIDTWFAGYTPELATAVWVGFDDRRPVEKATGGSVAAPIWGQFMAVALENVEATEFSAPPGVDRLGPVQQPTAPPAPPQPADGGVESGMEILYD